MDGARPSRLTRQARVSKREKKKQGSVVVGFVWFGLVWFPSAAKSQKVGECSLDLW
jgi:hypothetical protein